VDSAEQDTAIVVVGQRTFIVTFPDFASTQNKEMHTIASLQDWKVVNPLSKESRGSDNKLAESFMKAAMKSYRGHISGKTTRFRHGISHQAG
jgi:hypothetical protein